MDKFKGAIALESAQFIDSDFAEELLVEFQRLRDVGDFSKAAMKKCKVTALTKLYTDIADRQAFMDRVCDIDGKPAYELIYRKFEGSDILDINYIKIEL